MFGQLIVPILIALALLVIVRCIRIVPQAQAYVVTRLGAYKTTWDVGLHMKVPFLEQIAKRVSLKEQVADSEFSRTALRDAAAANVYRSRLVRRSVNARKSD